MKIGRKLIIASWSMYDFAGTTFSMNVITLYFALWVTVDMHRQDIFYSLSYSTSMLLAALSSPILGAVSDQIKKRMPFLIIFTIISCIFTSIIGVTSHFLLALLFFAIANYFFQICDILYNALLPDVSENKNVGKISGIGKGFAYLGTIVGLAIVSPFAVKYGRQATFIPSSIIFIIFSLPCFIFVKDRKPFRLIQTKIIWKKIIRKSFMEIKKTINNIKKFKGLGSFLISIFFAFNAINTVFIFMSVYTQKVVGFDGAQIIIFYMVSSAFAIVGSLFSGYITDRLGAKRTLSYSYWLWLFAITMAAITKEKMIFWILGPVVGICMGATWTSARTLATYLSPKNMYGEIFGFYGLVMKIGAIFGPIVWGAIILIFGFLGLIKYRIAVGSLTLFIIAGLIMLQRVPKLKKD